MPKFFQFFLIYIALHLFFPCLLSANNSSEPQPEQNFEGLGQRAIQGQYSDFTLLSDEEIICLDEDEVWVEESSEETPFFTDSYFEDKPEYQRVTQKILKKQSFFARIWDSFVGWARRVFRQITGIFTNKPREKKDTFSDRYRTNLSKDRAGEVAPQKKEPNRQSQVTIIKSRSMTVRRSGGLRTLRGSRSGRSSSGRGRGGARRRGG